MHRFILLISLGVGTVLAIEKECFELAKPLAWRCCKAPPPRVPHYDESLKECFKNFGNSSKRGEQLDESCELEQCIGKKLGYISDDGTMDKNAMGAEFAKKFEDRPELTEIIKKHCIDADVKEYGLEGVCELKKIAHCIHVHYSMLCPEFDDKEQCNEIKDLAEKCAAAENG